MIVSILILKAAWDISWPAIKQLADIGATPDECKEITMIALSTKGVEQVHAVRTRYSGSGIEVNLHVLVKSDITVKEGHDISTRVKEQLLKKGPDIIDVVVHIEPNDEK